MFKLKITVASILALTGIMTFTDSLASACVRNNALVSCDSKAWGVGLTALYIKPSFGGNGLGYTTYSNYGGADNQGAIVTNNGINYMHNVTPQWRPGFQLQGDCYFNATNDVNLSWYHFSEIVNGHLPPGTLFSGSADGFYAGNIQLATQWDAVNLEAGQHINFSDKKIFRIHAGLQAARIKNTFTNHPKLFATSSAYFTSTDDLSYAGIGPRVGADFGYVAAEGLSIYSKLAGSLLVGTAKQSISGYRDVINSTYGLIIFGIPNYTYSYNNVVIPELEAKLGISYNHQFAKSNVGVDFGYLWMAYLNAIVSYTGVGIVGSSVGQPATTNFDLNGLYLGITWSGDI